MKTKIFAIPVLTCALLLSGVSSLTAGLSGAIFTTNSSGTVVNGNQYDSPCSVYLNGGPGPHAPAHAAGLPDGDYYFQVTDPSGATLLSTDIVFNRSFHVTGGIIVTYTGSGGPVHVTGPNQNDPGGVTIRLANLSCPSDFLPTSNNGGAYKVWVTPVTSFVGDASKVDYSCGSGCFHGFVPSASKTDNFKVNTASATFCLTVQKLFLQADGSLTPGISWEFDVTDSQGVMNQFFTDTTGQVVVCDLVAGTSYTVAEDPASTVFSITGNVTLTTILPTSVSFTWGVGQPAVGIVFENQQPGGPQ
ncbi:MAG TPA: hypothetical protein VK776_01375 [Bryobacteraceae bacterium]|jgi:hypothetical protein|nr:hypothetical protein [Bryobacteraceae bacterium]